MEWKGDDSLACRAGPRGSRKSCRTLGCARAGLLGRPQGAELAPSSLHSHTSLRARRAREAAREGISVLSFPGGQMGRRLSAKCLQLPN